MNRWDEIKGAALDAAHHVTQDPAAREAMADDLITLIGLMLKGVGKVVAVEGESHLHDASTAEFPWDDGSYVPTPEAVAEAMAERADDKHSAHAKYLVGESMQAAADGVANESCTADLERWSSFGVEAGWHPRCGVCGLRKGHKMDCNEGRVEHTRPTLMNGEHPVCNQYPDCTASVHLDDLCPACDSEICRCW